MVYYFSGFGRLFGKFWEHSRQLGKNGGSSRNLAHQKSSLIAHLFRLNMLKGMSAFIDSVYVHSAFMRKGAGARIRLVGGHDQIGYLIYLNHRFRQCSDIPLDKVKAFL